MNIEEIAWPAAFCVVICVFFMSVTSCQENNDIQKAKAVGFYIDGDCKKVSIKGSSGTHWVCGEQISEAPSNDPS